MSLDRGAPSTVTGAQPSKKTGNGQHGRDLRGDDLYPTPPALTRALLRAVPELPIRIWEPAAGMGHMAAVLEKHKHDVYCSDLMDYKKLVVGSPEIETGKDFLQAERAPFPGRDWTVVTNPPFILSANFVVQGLKFCDSVYILNRLAFLEGRVRGPVLDKHLTDVWVFENRAPMIHRWSMNEAGAWSEWSGKKSDSAMAFAWFRFEPTKNDPTRLHRIRWRKEDNIL
jgi:predicted RNA methylase